MRTFGALALTLIVALSLVGCSATKVAVVEPSRLFQDSEPGKAGMEHLKQIETAMQAQLEAAQGLMEKSPNDEALRARFQKVFLGYQQLVNAEQQKVVERINELMQKTLDDYRMQKGYAVIMNADGLLSYDPKADVTSEIIAEMNRTKLSFEPVKLDEIAAPAAVKPATPSAPAPSTNSTKPAGSGN